MSEEVKRVEQIGQQFLAQIETMEQNAGRIEWDEVVQLAQTLAEELSAEGITYRATYDYLMNLLNEGLSEVFNERKNHVEEKSDSEVAS